MCAVVSRWSWIISSVWIMFINGCPYHKSNLYLVDFISGRNPEISGFILKPYLWQKSELWDVMLSQNHWGELVTRGSSVQSRTGRINLLLEVIKYHYCRNVPEQTASVELLSNSYVINELWYAGIHYWPNAKIDICFLCSPCTFRWFIGASRFQFKIEN